MTFPRGPLQTHGSAVSKQLGTHQPPRHPGELQLYPPPRANRRLQQLTPRAMLLPSERHPVPPLQELPWAHAHRRHGSNPPEAGPAGQAHCQWPEPLSPTQGGQG